jgi:hypothetical protein
MQARTWCLSKEQPTVWWVVGWFSTCRKICHHCGRRMDPSPVIFNWIRCCQTQICRDAHWVNTDKQDISTSLKPSQRNGGRKARLVPDFPWIQYDLIAEARATTSDSTSELQVRVTPFDQHQRDWSMSKTIPAINDRWCLLCLGFLQTSAPTVVFSSTEQDTNITWCPCQCSQQLPERLDQICREHKWSRRTVLSSPPAAAGASAISLARACHSGGGRISPCALMSGCEDAENG